MELRHFHYFVTVAEELHFTRASIRLHMAQPPLSRQIRCLEEEIGVQLFRRTKRRVELTEPGRQFLVSAREILDRVDRAVTQAQRVAKGEEGQISIGVISSMVIGDTIPKVLRDFRSRFPAVSITLQEMSAIEQMEALRAGRIQIGFMRPPSPDNHLTVTPLLREPLVAVLPSEHPLAGRQRISLKSLAMDPFITVPRGQSLGGTELVMEACLRAGFTPNIAQHALELQSIIGYVASGFGVSLVPQAARRMAHTGVSFVSLSWPKVHIEKPPWFAASRSRGRPHEMRVGRARSPSKQSCSRHVVQACCLSLSLPPNHWSQYTTTGLAM